MRLRTARLDDVPALARLERDCFGDQAWSEAVVQAELADVPGIRYVVVAAEGDSLVGYGVLTVASETADIQRVAVAAGCRRRGTGRRLLAELLHEASRRGCSTVLLELAADNVAARALYAAAGLSTVTARQDYYGPGRDAVVMSRSLDGGTAGSE